MLLLLLIKVHAARLAVAELARTVESLDRLIVALKSLARHFYDA